MFLTLEKLINGSIIGLKMTYLWDILKIKLYYDSIIQHLYESKGLFQDFAKLTNGISLGYSGNILE
jgi:hypothetical protein